MAWPWRSRRSIRRGREVRRARGRPHAPAGGSIGGGAPSGEARMAGTGGGRHCPRERGRPRPLRAGMRGRVLARAGGDAGGAGGPYAPRRVGKADARARVREWAGMGMRARVRALARSHSAGQGPWAVRAQVRCLLPDITNFHIIPSGLLL